MLSVMDNLILLIMKTLRIGQKCRLTNIRAYIVEVLATFSSANNFGCRLEEEKINKFVLHNVECCGTRKMLNLVNENI